MLLRRLLGVTILHCRHGHSIACSQGRAYGGNGDCHGNQASQKEPIHAVVWQFHPPSSTHVVVSAERACFSCPRARPRTASGQPCRTPTMAARSGPKPDVTVEIHLDNVASRRLVAPYRPANIGRATEPCPARGRRSRPIRVMVARPMPTILGAHDPNPAAAAWLERWSSGNRHQSDSIGPGTG